MKIINVNYVCDCGAGYGLNIDLDKMLEHVKAGLSDELESGTLLDITGNHIILKLFFGGSSPVENIPVCNKCGARLGFPEGIIHRGEPGEEAPAWD